MIIIAIKAIEIAIANYFRYTALSRAMFRSQACCKECNEQYPLPSFALSGKITEFDRTCPK